MRPTVPLLLALASMAIVGSAFVPGLFGTFLLAGAVAAFPSLLIFLATRHRARPAARWVPAGGLALLLVGTLGALQLVDASGGAPPGTGLLLMLVGLWLAPLVFVAFAYARWTEDTTLDERTLARLRRLAGGKPHR